MTSLYRFASCCKPELFLKRHAKRSTFCLFNFSIGSRPDGLCCSASLIESSFYNKCVLTLCRSQKSPNGLFQAVNHFVQGTNDSDKVPDLQGKSYLDFKLTKKDWEKLKLMHEVLRV